jgi:hypothetical protein
VGRKPNRADGWDSDDWEVEDGDSMQFEKINRRQKAALPVSSSKSGGRSAKETASSRKVRKIISQKSGGMHRRRIKKIY